METGKISLMFEGGVMGSGLTLVLLLSLQSFSYHSELYLPLSIYRQSYL